MLFIINPMNLVGVDERIGEIESLLEMESQDVRIVGIWGMGGIGKTTIAGAVYNKIFTEFEASLFFANIREELKTCTVVDLERRFVSRLLDQEIQDLGPLRFGNNFIKDRLRQKKVLIVFDDVDNSMVLQELLLGHHDSFGPGSRILVTSRDQHVLRQEVDVTYKVEALDDIEALQLLKSKAFRKTYPTAHYEDLLEKMVKYAGGNPLALVALGSALCDRSKEDWYSALDGLRQIKKVEIQDVLKISYDGLNKEEKNIFLDIACFFKGIDRYTVTKMLEKKSPSVHYCISVLLDKSLITASYGTLGMHDLLREMAYVIVCKDPKKPRKRSRLVDPEDISHVLEKRKGAKAVRGICLDMPESMEMQLKSDAFAGMRSLEFLIVKGNTCEVHLPRHGLEYLPTLKYFRWDGYPSKSFPNDFCAENIFQLDCPDSKLAKLWSGQQNLVYLRSIDLSKSECLTTLPDLSTANILQYVKLEYCSSLIEVPSYFERFENLEYLSLRGCSKLKFFPWRIGSKIIKKLSLADCSSIKKSPEISGDIEVLDLSGTAIEELQLSFGYERAKLYLLGCSKMTKFPEISGNLTALCLDGTSIAEVPSSVQFLRNLQELGMDNCKKLSRLPSSICKLKSLEKLNICGCSKLESFPEIMEPMESLVFLNLGETAIRELHSSIQFLTNLSTLYMPDCKKLSRLPNSLCKLQSLAHLNVSGCSKLESFPEIMEPMEFLKTLDIRDTAIRELPSSITLLKSLDFLLLGGTPIKELPELPPSLTFLNTKDCESLETTSTLGDSLEILCSADCFKFNHKALMAEMQLKFQVSKEDCFGLVFPGSEIPEWFSDQSMGSSLTILFPSNPRLKLKAVAFCLVVVDPYCPNDLFKLDDQSIGYYLSWKWQPASNNGDIILSSYSSTGFLQSKIPESDHMYNCYSKIQSTDLRKYFGREITFRFYPFVRLITELNYDPTKREKIESEIERHFKVERCGIRLLYDENPDQPSIFDEDQ